MKTYSLTDFEGVPSAKEQVFGDVDIEGLPSVQSVISEARWPEQALELFNRGKDYFELKPDGSKEDRSGAMSFLAYTGAEFGWSNEQIMAVLLDADSRWEKYTGRRPETRRNVLLKMVARAREKYGYNYSATDIGLTRLLQGKDSPVDVIDDEKSKLVYGFQDFVETEFKIDWILDQLFAVGGFGLLVAHPGVGKTTLAIQAGAALATGADKFLKWPNLGGTKKVLLLSLEMGKAPLNHFLSQISGNYPDKQTLNRNFLVAPFGIPIPLDTEPGQQFLNNLMEEYMPDVLIIDSLQKISSKELTDEQAAKNLVHYLSSLRDTYKTSLLVIHHNRKKPNDAQKKSVELSDVYGSTYITTDVDFVMNLHKVEDDLVVNTLLKNRLGATPEPFEMVRGEHLTFHVDMDGIQNRFAHRGNDDEGRGGMLDV